MAISKVVYKSSSSATPVTWIDATPSTATASDIIAPKTAMLSDGVITTGTGSGGGSNWTLLATREYTINSTSTGETVENITLNLSDVIDPEVPIWAHIRDKAGKRNGYFYGYDALFVNYKRANNATDYYTPVMYQTIRTDDNGLYVLANNTRGVYARLIQHTSANHFINIYVRYDSSYGTINGTYKVDIYKLTTPSGFTMFDVEE